MKTITEFKSIIDVVNYFSNEDFNMKYLEKERWDGEVICAFCGHDKTYRIEKYKRFKCADCLKQFNAMTGTIFQGKRISLQTWFVGYYLFATLPAISSYRMAKEVGVTQKTAWYMLQRIRFGLGKSDNENNTYMKDAVEADETFVGGKNKNRHRDKKVKNSQGRSFKDKTPVLGIMEKEEAIIIRRPHKLNPLLDVKEKVIVKQAKIQCFVLPNTQAESIQPLIKGMVSGGSILVSDEWWGYSGLNSSYDHRIIDHRIKEYVNKAGDTTNRLEGAWALFKRGLQVYYHVSKKHLNKYVSEFVFKYNTRIMNQTEKFNFLINNTRFHVSYNRLIKT